MELVRINNHPQLDPMTVAKVFKESGMFPDIQSEAAACAKIIIGRGLGLTDFDAMSGLHIIKGKAVLAANLMAAAIKRAGKYDYRANCTDTECSITFFGRDANNAWDQIGEAAFSLEDAKRAQLSGDNWRKYPKAMLFARCISAGYKQHCPDALGAAPVYVESHGETEITEDAPIVAPVIDARPEPKSRKKVVAEPEIVIDAAVAEDARALGTSMENQIWRTKQKAKIAAEREQEWREIEKKKAAAAVPMTPAPKKPAPAPVEQLPWLKSGTDVLTPLKCVARGATQTAVLFADESGVKNWVAVNNELIGAVKLNVQCEVDYSWTAGNYYVASRISVYGGAA